MHPAPGTTTFTLRQLEARISPERGRAPDRHEGWALRVLEGRERVRAIRHLKKLERRRRQHGGGGPRIDPHGQHRTIVALELVVSLSDWIDDKMYPTVTP